MCYPRDLSQPRAYNAATETLTHTSRHHTSVLNHATSFEIFSIESTTTPICKPFPIRPRHIMSSNNVSIKGWKSDCRKANLERKIFIASGFKRTLAILPIVQIILILHLFCIQHMRQHAVSSNAPGGWNSSVNQFVLNKMNSESFMTFSLCLLTSEDKRTGIGIINISSENGTFSHQLLDLQ